MTGNRHGWLESFAFVIEAKEVRNLRRNPEFAAYAGSKWLALPWLVLVSVAAGALGGLAVSGALWSRWWHVALLPVAYLAFFAGAIAGTLRVSGKEIAGLVGWCVFFATLIGVFTMWAAQTESRFWCYAIAGGLTFFLLGITGPQLPPPHSTRSEEWFMTSAIAAPAGSCLATWLYRNHLPEPNTLASAAFTGGLAAFVFLGAMASLYLLAWKPGRGLARLASLYLHNDQTAPDAARLFTTMLSADARKAALLARRGLAHALAGDRTAADADWARALELDSKCAEVDLCRGWLALRRDDPVAAVAAFGAVLDRRTEHVNALVGLGLAQLGSGDARSAVDALSRVRRDKHDGLSLTYLAEAQLALGDARGALATTTDAIEEQDSIHGRSWLVQGRAQRALGEIDAAALDYNRAIWAADEAGIERQARAELDAIGRPVTDEGFDD